MNSSRVIMPEGYTPQPQDILCGKTKFSFNHVGNRQFRATIATFLEEYTASNSRTEHGKLIASIVDQIIGNGGRFLKEEHGFGWIELSTCEARQKVGHALRDSTVLQQQHQNQDKTGATTKKRSHSDNNHIDPMEDDSVSSKWSSASLSSSSTRSISNSSTRSISTEFNPKNDHHHYVNHMDDEEEEDKEDKSYCHWHSQRSSNNNNKRPKIIMMAQEPAKMVVSLEICQACEDDKHSGGWCELVHVQEMEWNQVEDWDDWFLSDPLMEDFW